MTLVCKFLMALQTRAARQPEIPPSGACLLWNDALACRREAPSRLQDKKLQFAIYTPRCFPAPTSSVSPSALRPPPRPQRFLILFAPFLNGLSDVGGGRGSVYGRTQSRLRVLIIYSDLQTRAGESHGWKHKDREELLFPLPLPGYRAK